MKKAAIAVIAALSFTAVLHAGEAGVAVTRQRCSDTGGKTLWESTVTTAPMEGEPGAYIITEEGKGLYYGFEGETSCRSEAKYTSGKEGIMPCWLKRTVLSAAGKVLLEETQDYGAGKGEVRYLVKDFVKGSEKKKTFKYKGVMINKMLTGATVRSMLDAGEKQRVVNIVNDEPAVYSITIRVEGREKITANGREMDAFRVCIDPNIGLLSPVKAFIPKNYSWYSCEPPYRWLKFKGLEASISSPVVEMTALEN